MYGGRGDNTTIVLSADARMELSKEISRGLENIQNSSLINDETFGQLLDIVVSDIAGKSDAKSLARIYGSKPDVVKNAYADVVGLFLEAARHQYDAENLATFLHSAKMFGPRAERLAEFYGKYRDSIIAQLAQIGNGLPTIVDVDWRLDYCVKSSTNNTIGECLYHVRFVTKKHGKLDHVQFTCTLQQLQDMVYKLKEAARHVEKIANS